MITSACNYIRRAKSSLFVTTLCACHLLQHHMPAKEDTAVENPAAQYDTVVDSAATPTQGIRHRRHTSTQLIAAEQFSIAVV